MGNYTGNYKADIVIGVEIDERKGNSWIKGAYTYIKYDIVGLVGIKLTEHSLVHIGLRGVGSIVSSCSIGNFYNMTITVKLDKDGKCESYLLTEEKRFRSLVDLETTKFSTTDMLVFNKKHSLLYSTLDSQKIYFEIFRFVKSSSGDRKVVLEIDIETMQESIVSIDGLASLSQFSDYTVNLFDNVKYLFDTLQDGVYVFGNVAILYKCNTSTLILPKECKHAVFVRGSIKEVVFGSLLKYISVSYSPFRGEQKLYISKDSSKEFIGALLQAIYFSGEPSRLHGVYDNYELQYMDGESFYNICKDIENSETVKDMLKDKEIVVY